MRRYIQHLPFRQGASNGVRPDFSVNVVCRDNPKCVFTHRDLHFDVVIKNNKEATIQLPLEFMRNVGPMLTLHDNRSKRSKTIPLGMPDAALLSNLTVVGPGQSVSIPCHIGAETLERMGGTAADVTAVIKVGAPLAKSTEFHIIGRVEFRITGTDVSNFSCQATSSSGSPATPSTSLSAAPPPSPGQS